MKKLIRKEILLFIALFLFSILLIGCFSTIPTDENKAPVINSSPITIAEVNQLYTYDIEATDTNGDSLTYSLTVSPTGMSINSSSGVIAWTPDSEGDYDVTVEVSDGALTDTQSFIIHISQPTITNLKLTPASQTVTVGNQGTVNVVVENVTNLMGADITLTFDNTKLSYISAAAGSFWLPEGLLIFSPLATGGSVNIQLSAEAANIKSGTGTIITVTFERIASGVTDICFGTTDLRDASWQAITHTKGGCCSFN